MGVAANSIGSLASAEKRLAKALSASWAGRGLSVSSDDWPGVVASGAGWRVVLPRDVSGYRLQTKQGRSQWLPVYGLPSNLRPLDAAWFCRFPDLAAALESLPLEPFEAVKAFVAAQNVPLPDVRRRSYWLAPDYSGVLRTDANLRAVRDALGVAYAVQWIKPADYEAGLPVQWITQASGPSFPALVDALLGKTFGVGLGGADRAAIGLRLAALFDGFPENAMEGPWNNGQLGLSGPAV